jgi:uncharacterized lipoprotein YmbA
MMPRLSHVLLAVGVTFAASSCGLLSTPRPAPTDFYVLTGVGTAPTAAAERRLSLGIGPIEFPSYLNRPEMVSRVAENQLSFDEFHRWGEPFKDNFTHVLATDLDNQLSLARVTFYPWYNTTPMDFAVSLSVLRFEPQPSGDLLLRARWIVTNGRDPTILANHEFVAQHPGGTPEENAAGLSQLVAQLADEIATTLRSLR